MLSLQKDEVHIHLRQPGLCIDSDEDILDHAEQQRAHLFRFARDRDLYVSAHSFLRQVLSRYAPVSPEDWRFVTNPFGKPSVANPDLSWLNFNLSHTQGLIACAITKNRQIGVDVERGKRRVDVALLCQHVLSTIEAADVLSTPYPEEQEQRFYRYWTLKEAYIKAKGVGLSQSLQQFSIVKTNDESWMLNYETGFRDPNDRWQFGANRLGENHYLAYCVQTEFSFESSQTIGIRLFEADLIFA